MKNFTRPLDIAIGAALLLWAGCFRYDPSTEDMEPLPTAPAETAATEEPLFDVEDGFGVLTLADFAEFPTGGGAWSEKDGALICSGDPRGYIHSRRTYDNFTLRVEYRFAAAKADDAAEPGSANTGFMIHIQEPHKVWPRSWEVQGKQAEMCSIKANGGAAELTIDDDADARESARKPVGEWNSVEIVSRDGALTAVLNGEQVCRSEPGELTSGLIGLQSEGYEVHFRNLRVREEE